jgi:peroxiredoxin
MNGHDVRLADFKGKALLVNFWSTTCGPCQLETPELVDLAAKYKDRGFAVVGISIDDSPKDIRAFANEFKVPYPLLVGDGREEVTDAFGLKDAIPMSVFITARGTVLGRLEGLATQPWLERQIQSLFDDVN